MGRSARGGGGVRPPRLGVQTGSGDAAPGCSRRRNRQAETLALGCGGGRPWNCPCGGRSRNPDASEATGPRHQAPRRDAATRSAGESRRRSPSGCKRPRLLPLRRQRAPQATPPSPQGAAAPATSAPEAPTPPTRSAAPAPSAGRAAMLIASADNPQKPAVSLGSTVWSLIPPAPNQPATVAVKAEADIPISRCMRP